MINVKLIVLFFSIDIVASFNKYCQICPNHTFCKYKMPGPSSSCKEYDESSRLTKEDVNNIVNKMNDRRNFVATGLSRILPQAANMNKIYWSEELAAFAQRWVDQCDPETRPDRKDECRDLEEAQVGQAILSVAGPAPGMHVKNLVDVWFTETLDYKGSVSYYNHSRDWKTNYFTQLIWGETDRVGCGKARFYVDTRNTMIERLVCNFAPRGNVHGKPVYAVGYPATQCQKHMVPDLQYKGLCSYWIDHTVRKFTTVKPPVSSLLRIINLSYNSVKHEIDPIKSNMRQINFGLNDTNGHRNQKTRHVFHNNSFVAMKNFPPFPQNHPWKFSTNFGRTQKSQIFQQERGHSRVYHGHDLHSNNNHNFESEAKPLSTENFRRYEFTTEPSNDYSADDYRRRMNQECTRKHPSKQECTTCDPVPNQCTRRHATEKCFHSTPCSSTQCAAVTTCQDTHDICECNTPSTPCATLPPKCKCNGYCECFNVDCTTPKCLSARKSQNGDQIDGTRKDVDFHYYDLWPRMAIRSGDSTDRTFQSKSNLELSPRDTWLQQETTTSDFFKRFTRKMKESDRRQVKDIFEFTTNINPDPDYIYDSSDSRERKRRKPPDDITFRPFWQMDEFNLEIPNNLKSLKFTTISNKKQRITNRLSTTLKIAQTTETITLKEKETSSINQQQKKVVTEKYLSFDELMHLRRFGSSDATIAETNSDARRKAGTTPSGYTTNTPFIRKKHCTRKLTCTWTALSVTAHDGSIIVPGLEGDRGSRTPPGYVEGCTRTSTCTREYMDRNKFSTSPVSAFNTSDQYDQDMGQDQGVGDDGDYCEKRALNVRRRDSNENSERIQTFPQQESTENPSSFYFISIDKSNEDYNIISTTPTTVEKCPCHFDISRVKRNRNNMLLLPNYDNVGRKQKRSKENLSYGDLYYLVLHKIMKTWSNTHNSCHMRTCICNTGALVTGSILLILFLSLYNITLNLFI